MVNLFPLFPSSHNFAELEAKVNAFLSTNKLLKFFSRLVVENPAYKAYKPV